MQPQVLWASLKRGDHTALKGLYDLYVDDLYRYGMVVGQDESKVMDAIHDLYIYLWEKRESIGDPQSVKAYLLASVRRRLTGSQRHLESTETREAQDLSSDPGMEERWIEYETEEITKGHIADAIGQLSSRQQEILHLKYYQQLSYEQIAEQMQMNYQSARNLVTRTLAAMRTYLNTQKNPPGS